MEKFSITRRTPMLPPAVQHFLANPLLRDNLRQLKDACAAYPQIFALWAERITNLENHGRHAEAHRLWSFVLQHYRGAPALDPRPLHHQLRRADGAWLARYVQALQERLRSHHAGLGV